VSGCRIAPSLPLLRVICCEPWPHSSVAVSYGEQCKVLKTRQLECASPSGSWVLCCKLRSHSTLGDAARPRGIVAVTALRRANQVPAPGPAAAGGACRVVASGRSGTGPPTGDLSMAKTPPISGGLLRLGRARLLPRPFGHPASCSLSAPTQDTTSIRFPATPSAAPQRFRSSLIAESLAAPAAPRPSRSAGLRTPRGPRLRT